MKRTLIAGCVLTLALASAGSAQAAASSADNGPHYSQAQLKQLARDAHTQEQFNALSLYYGQQQSYFNGQAAAEKQEWARRSQITVSLYAKYPRPADEAKYLYEYYVAKAADAAALSAKYSQLAAQSAAPVQK
jgi:hypothetical protein